jgi:hypothetical protein
MNNPIRSLEFANGIWAININNPNMIVRAVVRTEHGDWKTQLIKGFRGIEKDQEGNLIKVWCNGYGTWCRVKLFSADFHVDVPCSALEILSPIDVLI